MGEDSKSLSKCFTEAETCRKKLHNGGAGHNSSSEAYQQVLRTAITGYEDCVRIADQVSLFSRNESLEDISSSDLQYLLIHFYLGDLHGRVNESRKASLEQSRKEYETFLKQLDAYDILFKEDSRIYQRYLDSRKDSDDDSSTSTFSTAASSDAAARRNAKIARFKEERALQAKLEHLSGLQSGVLAHDDATLREIHLTHISLCTHQTFANLESIAQELAILALAPSSLPPTNTSSSSSSLDERTRHGAMAQKKPDDYSERLDPPLHTLLSSASLNGPILSADGRPMRPFTLLDTRARLRDGVFRPDHNLPTMTIDEYLEEERRRGGIIEKGSGGEASGRKQVVDEDDMDAVDRRTMEQRQWDAFTEANPRGSGNTMNMG